MPVERNAYFVAIIVSLRKTLNQKRSLAALFVAVAVVVLTFFFEWLSFIEAVLMLAAFMGGSYAFMLAFFSAFFEHLRVGKHHESPRRK